MSGDHDHSRERDEEHERGEGDEEHDHHHHDVDEVGVGVVTVSSTRTLEEDPSGDYVAAAFEEAGHEVPIRESVPDEFDRVQDTVNRLIQRDDTDVVVTSGGTGVTPDDVTPEAVGPLLHNELPGFGELFRRLSYDEIGTKTIGSRAMGGVVDETLVFCLPGSKNAVRLGVDDVILPEIGHLSGLVKREE